MCVFKDFLTRRSINGNRAPQHFGKNTVCPVFAAKISRSCTEITFEIAASWRPFKIAGQLFYDKYY